MIVISLGIYIPVKANTNTSNTSVLEEVNLLDTVPVYADKL